MEFLLILDTVKKLNEKCSQAEEEGCLRNLSTDGLHIGQSLFGGFHISKKT
jgi:hypothetical protein